MKAALLATPLNIDIARAFLAKAGNAEEYTVYFKRGNVCQKRHKESQKLIYNDYKIAIIRDIKAEDFDHFILVELPHGYIKLLPYYVLVALLSRSPKKLVLHGDGTVSTMTYRFLIKLAFKMMGFLFKLLLLLPLAIINLFLVLVMSSLVDLGVLLESKLIKRKWSFNRAMRAVK